jgi:hypothetical protein
MVKFYPNKTKISLLKGICLNLLEIKISFLGFSSYEKEINEIKLFKACLVRF